MVRYFLFLTLLLSWKTRKLLALVAKNDAIVVIVQTVLPLFVQISIANVKNHVPA